MPKSAYELRNGTSEWPFNKWKIHAIHADRNAIINFPWRANGVKKGISVYKNWTSTRNKIRERQNESWDSRQKGQHKRACSHVWFTQKSAQIAIPKIVIKIHVKRLSLQSECFTHRLNIEIHHGDTNMCIWHNLLHHKLSFAVGFAVASSHIMLRWRISKWFSAEDATNNVRQLHPIRHKDRNANWSWRKRHNWDVT